MTCTIVPPKQPAVYFTYGMRVTTITEQCSAGAAAAAAAAGTRADSTHDKIDTLTDMGYDVARSTSALKAADGDMQLAVDTVQPNRVNPSGDRDGCCSCATL